MHASVIQSPQAMSNDQSYRPRSPNLSGLAEPHSHPQQQQHHQQQHPPRLSRLPSYQIQEPSLPKGYSFSPRGSYDASPFFSQNSQHSSNSYFPSQYSNPHPEQLHSPPNFAPASLPDQPQVFSPISFSDNPQRQPLELSFSTPSYQPSQHESYSQQQQLDEMARLRSRKPVNYNDDHNGAQYEEPVQNYLPQQPVQQQQQQQQQQQPPHIPIQPHQQFMQPLPLTMLPQAPLQAPPLTHLNNLHQHQQQHQQQHMPISSSAPLPAVDVKTKFPVARIKRIMQADEDVGKVAQATPTAVSKALELFMIALVSKGAAEANANNSKKVTATHLKHALLADPQFDFLNEICESVPDEGGRGSKGRAKSEAKSEDSDEEMTGVPKKKGKGRKKKGTDAEGDFSD